MRFIKIHGPAADFLFWFVCCVALQGKQLASIWLGWLWTESGRSQRTEGTNLPSLLACHLFASLASKFGSDASQEEASDAVKLDRQTHDRQSDVWQTDDLADRPCIR